MGINTKRALLTILVIQIILVYVIYTLRDVIVSAVISPFHQSLNYVNYPSNDTSGTSTAFGFLFSLLRKMARLRSDSLVPSNKTFLQHDGEILRWTASSRMSTTQRDLVVTEITHEHRPSFLDCHLPAGVRPTYVSVSYQPSTQATNRFKITYPGPRIRNFTVCYSVLHSRYSWASQLIESIEMNRILGAEHFFVYNYSISPEVDQILRRYQEDGLVTVLPWSLPTEEVHYYSQMTALNDCNYRNRNVSRFVIILDTDELIIPRNNLSWMELIDTVSPREYDVSAFMRPSLISRQNQSTGSFEFMSSYFTINWRPNWAEVPSQFQFSLVEKKTIERLKIITLSQIWRSSYIFPATVRSKYIARPENVAISGIHYVWEFSSSTNDNGSSSSLVVNADLALVNHYKITGWTDVVVDATVLRFKDQLYPRLIAQFGRFSGVFQ